MEGLMAFTRKLLAITLAVGIAGATLAPVVTAQTVVGVTATEIKIGHTNPYSGPASAYGTIGKTIGAYFKKVNDEGGINGRKINFITYDDGYSPPKTVEMVRKLVEQDQVALMFQTLGTPPNSAIHKYMNQQKVPHLFVATGATKWNDPKNFPWTMGFQPNYQTEGRVYAADVLKKHPGAKVGILYQNDDYGKDYLKGFEDGLGDKAKSLIVMKQSYEVTDPTIDSQIVNLKNSGATVFFNITIPQFRSERARRQGEEPDRHEAELRGHRSHDRLADRESEEQRRDRLLQHHDSEVRGAGDQEGARHRLEARALPEQRVELARDGAEAGRARGLQGPHHRALHEGSHRPAVAQRQGLHGLGRLHEEVLPGRGARRPVERLRLQRRDPDDGRAQAVRQRPLAREHHEAGGQSQERGAAAPAPGDQDQHQPHGLRADRAGAARPVQRREVGPLRRDVRRLPQAVAEVSGGPEGSSGPPFCFLQDVLRLISTRRLARARHRPRAARRKRLK